LRLQAVKQLREAGLAVGVSASPLIPGITDREGDLEAVAAAAKEMGAQWFFSGVLFLMPSSAKQFLPFVREKFPRLAKQYEEWYAKNGMPRRNIGRGPRCGWPGSERVWICGAAVGGGQGKVRCSQMSLSWDVDLVGPSVVPPEMLVGSAAGAR